VTHHPALPHETKLPRNPDCRTRRPVKIVAKATAPAEQFSRAIKCSPARPPARAPLEGLATMVSLGTDPRPFEAAQALPRDVRGVPDRVRSARESRGSSNWGKSRCPPPFLPPGMPFVLYRRLFLDCAKYRVDPGTFAIN